MSFVIEPLGTRHDRNFFSCGTEALDVYLRERAGQDLRRNISSVFVLVEDGDSRVLGYYTLAPAGIPYVNLQANEQKAMPRYSSLPAIRLGRLAVDIHFRNRKMGVFLLLDAMRYALNLPIAWRFFIVDAKESAVAFYKKFAFIPCLDDDKLLYLSRQDVENFCAV